MSKLTEKSTKELLDYQFWIPAYQRGYRWTERQVEDLLDDINNFTPEVVNSTNNKTWYCLQPVVVMLCTAKTKSENNLSGDWFEVIDGQQRLTTIFLILAYLSSKKFPIKFETRNDQFLNDVSGLLSKYELERDLNEQKGINQGVSNHYNEFIKSNLVYDHIDNFHLFRAFLIIKKWFESKEKDKFRSILLNQVKVIWYETQGDEVIDIFTRINMGKIPLTNAELIKALFLNSSNFKAVDSDKQLRLKQLEIASEWDRMEYALQDDAFWYFINKEENNMATRIEFIFDLMADKTNKTDDYFTFLYFSNKFKDQPINDAVEQNWKEIKQYYQTLEEWFTDRELYHKIGFLIATGTDIKDILVEKSGKTKAGFKGFLNIKIQSKVDVQLKDLEYPNGKVRDVLLLHNIQTMLNNENETNRFSFDRYKKEKWDVEHIHAIATEVKVKKEDQKQWIKDNCIKNEEYKNDAHYQTIREICNGNLIEENEFQSIIEYVLGEGDDNIRNLCLLDRGTNRSYKNDSFKAKRAKIIKQEMTGVFIPICTKNVFMKHYSEDFKDLELWNEPDREAYLKDINTTLNTYLPKQAPSNDEQ